MFVKGQYDLGRKVVYFIPIIILLAMIMIYTLVFFGGFRFAGFDEVSGFGNMLIVNRLVNSENCFAFEDGRVHVGVLDVEKFSDSLEGSNRLKRCLFYGSKGKRIFVSLDYEEKSYIAYNALEFGMNKDWVKDEINKVVVVRDGGVNYPGVLKVELS
jgi:hypothetical protein